MHDWVTRNHVDNRGLAQHLSGLEKLLSAYELFDGCLVPAFGFSISHYNAKKGCILPDSKLRLYIQKSKELLRLG